MRSCEGIGKTLEQAIDNALFELKAAREDVDIKILSEGGFLKKAKVVVSISEDALPKYEKREAARKKLAEEEAQETAKTTEKSEKGEKSEISEKSENSENSENSKKSENSDNSKKSDNSQKKTSKEDDDFAETFMKKKIDKQSKAKGEEGTSGKKDSHVRVFADDEISGQGESEDDADEDGEASAKKSGKDFGKDSRKLMSAEDFLKGLMQSVGIEGEIERVEDERYVRYNLSGENCSSLIGYHGECMYALSHFMQNVCKTENHKKVILDVGGYRAKRAESLTALAHKVANGVVKSGRYHKFEPMDPSERKVIHTALQDDDRVTTLSKGEEPRRYLIVFPKEYRED